MDSNDRAVLTTLLNQVSFTQTFASNPANLYSDLQLKNDTLHKQLNEKKLITQNLIKQINLLNQ